jgi:hypothetical protein
MGRFFILLGLVLLLLGGAFFFRFSQVEQPPPPAIEGIGPGAIDTVPIDPAVVNAAIDEANAIANAANAKGIDLRGWSRLLLVAVFIFGAFTSIAAGLQKIWKSLERDDTVLTIAIGVLGAASAIATSAAGHFSTQAEGRFTCVAAIEKEVAGTITSVRGERDPALAAQYVDDMRRSVQRCAP